MKYGFGLAWLGLGRRKTAEWPPEVRQRHGATTVPGCGARCDAVQIFSSRPIIYRSREGGKGCSLKGFTDLEKAGKDVP